MATATTARPIDWHPWLDAFLADPAVELDNLLSGHARIAPYESADAPDAARLLFGGLPDDDQALGALDRAVNEWLDSQRAGGVPEFDPLPLERWIRKVSEAVEIIGVLKLPHSALDLRQRFMVWNSWADRLAVSAQRDGRYAFLRTLALTQRLVAEAEPTVNSFALEPLWLRICEQADSAFPAHYLAVGLLGLRMLPERKGAPSELPWMAGLICWAIGQKPSVEEFSQHWWALKGLYPRMPSYWRSALQQTLRQSSVKKMPSEIKNWWLEDVQSKEVAIAQETQSQFVGVPILSPLSAVQSLRKRAGNLLPSITGEIEALVGERRCFAEVTGESYYLVTTACNIGMGIIKGADDPVGRGRLGVDLARQALAWQPANPYAWALWRDALATQGAFEAAELVGWESIRRFPENVQWRTQLALLLADLPGREAEAENLLRETMERFPDNIFARTQWAELLIALDRTGEATDVVDDIFSHKMENEVAVDLHARLLYHSGNSKAARNVLQSGLERFQHDPILRNHLSTLEKGIALPLKATAFRHYDTKVPDSSAVGTGVAADTTASQRGRLRRLFYEYRWRQGDSEWRGMALKEVRHALSEDPNLNYAKYLSRELEGKGGEDSASEAFAIAFIDALKRKDADRIARLEKSFPSQMHFVDVAKVFLFGDRAAADRALIWFAQEVRSEPRTVSALRGFLKERVDISSVENSNAFAKLVAGNDNVQTDLIESVLAGDELLLVA